MPHVQEIKSEIQQGNHDSQLDNGKSQYELPGFTGQFPTV